MFVADAAPLTAYIQSGQSNNKIPIPIIDQLIDTLDHYHLRPLEPARERTQELAIDRLKALHYHVPYENIHTRLKTIFQQRTTPSLQTEEGHFALIIGPREKDFRKLLLQMQVENQQGNSISLSEFIKVRQQGE